MRPKRPRSVHFKIMRIRLVSKKWLDSNLIQRVWMSPTAARAKHGSFVSRTRLAVTLLPITVPKLPCSVAHFSAGKALKVSHYRLPSGD